MRITNLLNSLSGLARQFRSCKRGNVMITFALATVPMIGFVGAAVDYSRGNSAKAAMQAAVDSTALMLSKSAAKMTAADINTKANSYFLALINRPEITNIVVTPNFTTTGGSQLVITATGKVATTFMKVMGQNNLNINVSSTVKWGNTRLRVALVLDVTGSMNSDGKITALRTAAKNFITQLQNAAVNNGDVYVSVIPFSKDVNVGALNYNATWIDWTDWDEVNGTCSNSWYKTKTNCEGNSKKWTVTNRNTWNGCVTDRGNHSTPHAGNYDTNVNIPDIGNPATLFPAEQYGSCPQEVMPLTYNWSALSTMVSNLSAGGYTNQGIGLVHGWQSLVGGGPYPTPPPLDPGYTYQQVIILMSDGLNTQNRWSSSQSAIDAREAMTCANAKAAGITIYAIQVNTGGDPTQSVMQNCASSPSKFFLLTSATQIVTTFQQIGTALSNLRVAQ